MSSFRKRIVQKPLPGTRTSAQTGQVITSSGNPSFDLILGGGLPMGSVCLIEEDKYVTYSKVLAKYFLAEGVFSCHTIFLGSLDDDPNELLRKLPRPLDEEEIEKDNAANREQDAPAQNGLRIAWRYNELPLVNSEQTSAKIGHHFNLMELMDPNLLVFVENVVWNDKPCKNEQNDDLNDKVHCDEAYDLDISGDEVENFVLPKRTTQESAMDASSETMDKINVAENKIDANQQQHSNESDNNKQNRESEDTDDDEMNTFFNEVQIDPKADAMDVETESSKATEMAAKQLKDEAIDEAPEDETSAKSSNSDDGMKSGKIFHNGKFERLLNKLLSFFDEYKYNGTSLIDRNPCRVCITSLGSPLWYDEDFSQDILKFLTILRATIRNKPAAVCFITMPMHLIRKSDETLVPRIRNLVDYAIELESFAGSDRETNPAFKEYNGLFHIRKLTAINTLRAHMPETCDLAFKLRRKKFVIETFHLPPELQDSGADATRALDDNDDDAGDNNNVQNNGNSSTGATDFTSGAITMTPTLGCASNLSTNPKVSLDF